MPEWTFPPPPARGHYEAVPYGPYICVVLNNRSELCFSLWRKTANENHVCHVAHNGGVVHRPAREPDSELEDTDDPHMQLVPIEVEEFHRLKFAARHLYTAEAWARYARRAAEQVCQII